MSKKPFNQEKFDATLEALFEAVKHWGNLETEDPDAYDEALAEVWITFDEFRPHYKKYRKLSSSAQSDPKPTLSFDRFMDSITDLLVKATENGIDPDSFFGRNH